MRRPTRSSRASTSSRRSRATRSSSGRTDPFPQTDRAWEKVVPEAAPWALAFSAELADLCDGRTSHTRPADLGFVVTSVWSNESSSAGHAHCLPQVAPAFAAPIPRAPDRITLPSPLLVDVVAPAGATSPGVIVLPGTSVDVTVHIHADTNVATTWHLSAVEPGVALLSPAGLGLALDRTDAVAGEDVTLRVKAPVDFRKPSIVILYLTGGAASPSFTRWPLLVSPSATP